MNITKEDIIKYFYGEKYLTKEIALVDFSKDSYTKKLIISIGLVGSKNQLIKYKETRIVKKEKNVIRNMMKYFSKSSDFVEVESKTFEQDSIIFLNKNFLKHQVLEVNQIEDNTGFIDCNLALKYSSIFDYWLHLDLQSFSILRKCFNDEDIRIIGYIFESKDRARILRERREISFNALKTQLENSSKLLEEAKEFEAKVPLILDEIKNIIGGDIYNGFLLKHELGEDDYD